MVRNTALFIIACVCSCWMKLVTSSGYPRDFGPDICGSSENFDIIVIGAGSGGLPLAARLSENREWNVLLLEQGPDPPQTDDINIPVYWPNNLRTSLDYQFKSETDSSMFQGLENKVASIPAGKCAGGSSVINAMFYLRGHRAAYDEWCKNGLKTWNYNTMKKYFRKAESYRDNGQFLPFDQSIHYTGGPQIKTKWASVDPAIPYLQNACEQIGLPKIRDLDNMDGIGYGISYGSVSQGFRYSVFEGYGTMCAHRKNFFFARNTTVRKIYFDKDEPTKAIGVEILRPDGSPCFVMAKREIIVSAGAINSPKLLMLSGIGPADHLAQMGINVRLNLPVGDNYHDHLGFVGIVWKCKPTDDAYVNLKISDELQRRTNTLIQQGIGTQGITEFMAFVYVSGHEDEFVDDADPSVPNVQIKFMRIPMNEIAPGTERENLLTQLLGFSPKVTRAIGELNKDSDLIFPMIILVNPKSRGEVRLRQNNIDMPPIIRPRFLSDPADLRVMLRAIDLVHKLSETAALKELNVEMQYVRYPGCAHLEATHNDQYWECAIRNVASGFYHSAGSVKMGSKHDPTAVVTPRCKVIGAQHLRVLDASLMPSLTYANPNAAVIAMAEHAADIIKEDHKIASNLIHETYEL